MQKYKKKKLGINSEIEENTVVTFIPKVFYLGPKTRTAIPKPKESLSCLVNMNVTVK